MKISLNEIKKYVPEAGEVETGELVRRIGARLVEVEGVEDWGEKYRGIYVVRVAECEEIPETHLHLCRVDAGKLNGEFGDSGEEKGDEAKSGSETSKNTVAKADKTGVQVVCGAPNVRAGMWAVWIAPGSVVPETFGGEDFRLGARKLRGYMSNGMLAALDELDLGTDYEGIVELDSEMRWVDADGVKRAGLEAGASFAEVFGLNDQILEIENKSLTHRPDTFGLVGFAREVAGALGVKFREPEWVERGLGEAGIGNEVNAGEKATKSVRASAGGKAGAGTGTELVTVKISDAELCPRYSVAVLEQAEGKKSPYLTLDAVFLAKAGMRSIAPIVDLTNILMLETGQPLHAFDYDKLVKVGGGGAKGKGALKEGVEIGVRAARMGEKLELLDGKTVECDENDILITAGDVPVALAGAMGGKNTEVDAGTRRIALEAATFSLYHLRKTQMKHGIFSEAITRFTKGQPAGMTGAVLGEAVRRLEGTVLEEVDEWVERGEENVVEITTSRINSLLGTDYTAELVVRTLENVGFRVERGSADAGSGSASVTSIEASAVGSDAGVATLEADDSLLVTAPAWRTDIHIPEDIIEEVGRLNGYDNIPQSLPTRPFAMTRPEPMLRLKTRVRGILSDQLGMHEVLTYSFVSGRLLGQVGEKVENSYRIVNSISPELQYFRQSLGPSLISKLPQNLKAGYRDFAIYEMNQVSEVASGLRVDDVEFTDTETSEDPAIMEAREDAGAESTSDAKESSEQALEARRGVPVMQQRLGIMAVQDYYTVKAKVAALVRRFGAEAEFREFGEVEVLGVDARGTEVEKSAQNAEFRENSIEKSAKGLDKNEKVCYNEEIGPRILGDLGEPKNYTFSTLTAENLPYFEPKRSAEIWLEGRKIGEIGEVKAAVLKNFKIKETVTGVEMNLAALLKVEPEQKSFNLSRFPTVTRDLTLKIAGEGPEYAEIERNLKITLKKSGLYYTLTPVSIYRPGLGGHTNYSFRITLTSFEKTLESEEITGVMEKVASAARKKLGAEVV